MARAQSRGTVPPVAVLLLLLLLVMWADPASSQLLPTEPVVGDREFNPDLFNLSPAHLCSAAILYRMYRLAP